MQPSPIVSVLVTVFNREKTLEETVKSILQSSFHDFEIIMVDDCSTDNSWDVMQSLCQKSPKIRCFKNDQNLGDYRNRNRAASYSSAKYLKYLDADDLIYPHSLGVMVEALERNSDTALALSSNTIDPETPYPIRISPNEFQRRHFLQKSPLGVGPSAAIIRRACFEEIGGFSGKQFVGDSELWLKIAMKWPIILLPPSLVWWRQHPDQQMSLERKKPEILNLRFSLELEHLRQCYHLSDSERSLAELRLRQHFARKLLSFAVRKRRPIKAVQLFFDSPLKFFDLFAGLRKYR
jgi:glycosyltransferase involved in cell wall biosynthesis